MANKLFKIRRRGTVWLIDDPHRGALSFPNWDAAFDVVLDRVKVAIADGHAIRVLVEHDDP